MPSAPRSTKRGEVRRILQILVQHGAPAEVLVDAHPHIGTNRLPQVVTAMRETIGAKELAKLFDLGFHARHVETIFKRVFGKSK